MPGPINRNPSAPIATPTNTTPATRPTAPVPAIVAASARAETPICARGLLGAPSRARARVREKKRERRGREGSVGY